MNQAIKSGDELGDKINQAIKSGNELGDKINQAIKSREFTTESDIRYICNIIKRLDEAVEMSKRQTSLMEFINQ